MWCYWGIQLKDCSNLQKYFLELNFSGLSLYPTCIWGRVDYRGHTVVEQYCLLSFVLSVTSFLPLNKICITWVTLQKEILSSIMISNLSNAVISRLYWLKTYKYAYNTFAHVNISRQLFHSVLCKARSDFLFSNSTELCVM